MRSVILLGSALALSACGDQGPSDEIVAESTEAGNDTGALTSSSDGAIGGSASDGAPIGMEEAARRAEGIVKPQPGQYRATVQVLDISLPGAPPQVMQQMEQMRKAGAQTREYCLTPEQANKGFEEMIKQANSDDACTFSKFEAEGGKIDAVMNCSRPGQGSGRMVMQGTGSRTSSNMTMTMNIEAPGGNQMTMKMRSQQERIGDC
ncbi:DUF3617 domain-containing protein [Erythrobacter litoralis]|uniref:DUF3617 domain-containing protein n=1 Tax=Erythrobacter litoralis TaxID=39960 RepID=UPI0024354DF3|nr:DUF3617 domain-containing protein [Erythrobacter litoralis]MDG6077593.1 DUF3617 domain-containing protein [Erythrobacter litoralis]